MGISSLFHKIKASFVRLGENPLPYVSSMKRYGNNGEDEFAYFMRQALPTGRMKRNIVIDTTDGNAEIDCLILYQDKLFAIEVKHWKGRLIETDNGFVQEKTDRWTGNLHIKNLKSPFKQLNRAVYLLKKQIPIAAWINSIVFFEEDEFESIRTLSDGIWFNDIDKLANYIMNDGKKSTAANSRIFFDKCVSADYLYAKNWDKSLHCIIEDDSLRFQTENDEICREQIRYIHINHHLAYDELIITLKDGNIKCITRENAKIRVKENGMIRAQALCKVDYIELGE